MSKVDVVIAVTGGADSLRTSLPSGQPVSIISASGQAIAGVVSALGPIGGAIAVNPAASIITLVKIGLDVRDSRSIDVGDAVSVVGNSVSVVAAICAVVPGGQLLEMNGWIFRRKSNVLDIRIRTTKHAPQKSNDFGTRNSIGSRIKNQIPTSGLMTKKQTPPINAKNI
ncbi:hypothetical protein [Ralstonia pseudosolanacearum]|uniref:Uncharacterized protein n=1 Tax=Ralstonia solanacearum TaxID=305 RepID=A0AA92EEB8_RALSL|nr:hypothetical protein [Ralstonia pseudosolanacearum]QCX50393.1 hypothetical protein E7Z57_15650 [Ralstonia pseudosolanacearum]